MSTLPAEGYLTVGIDTQIPWPSKEVVIDFRGRKFHLFPETDSTARMIRVETAPGFTQADADKLILELLSALAWAEQAEAVPTFGNWCSRPLGIGKGPRGVIGDGHFDYLPNPADPKAKLALALYREGLSVNLTPFQFLGFYKVINALHETQAPQTQWINANVQYITDGRAKIRLAEIQRDEGDVGKYLCKKGRNAIAHAYSQPLVNPDDPADLIRIDSDLPVIRELARIAIEREFGVKSEREFHREHLYELEGFRKLIGDALVAKIKAREEVPLADVSIPQTLALRVRDRDCIELFESLDASIVSVRDGCVRIRLVSICDRLEVFVTLDFGQEKLVAEPLTDIQFRDDLTPESARMKLQLMQLYRWWFGANGVIELWEKTTNRRLARAQHYMPPVNSRFRHDEFEKLESELRVRASALKGVSETDVRDGR